MRPARTSLLFAIGVDPVSVMSQLGHTHPPSTLPAYAHSMSRDAEERERLHALTDGDHGGIGGVAIGSEKKRRDAACGAEFSAREGRQVGDFGHCVPEGCHSN
jgi:hypothetical protein